VVSAEPVSVGELASVAEQAMCKFLRSVPNHTYRPVQCSHCPGASNQHSARRCYCRYIGRKGPRNTSSPHSHHNAHTTVHNGLASSTLLGTVCYHTSPRGCLHALPKCKDTKRRSGQTLAPALQQSLWWGTSCKCRGGHMHSR